MSDQSDVLLSIIIVSFNTAELTTQCIKSVVADVVRSKRLSGLTEILVVDNHSTDNSITALNHLTKQKNALIPIRLIKNQRNLGFSRANNQALEKARGEYILLLNSDTVVQLGALEILLNNFQSDRQDSKPRQLGLVAASLWNPDGSYQPQGGDQISLLSAACQWLMLDDLPLIGKYLPTLQRRQFSSTNPPTVQPMGWVGATALCFPRRVYESVGGLDETIFMYAEDVEFCLRSQRAGWTNAIAQQAKIIHLGSASSSSIQAKIGEVRGLLKIWPKYFGNLSTFFLKLIIYWGSLQRLILFTLLGRSSQANIYQQILLQL